MEKLNVVSKVLGVSKGKIKDMCKNGEITFELVNGVYYVDENEVKKKLEETLSNLSKITSYSVSNLFEVGVEIKNNNVFPNSDSCVEYYSLFFQNYVDYINQSNDENFFNFLNHIVNSDNCISDRLEESDFKIIESEKYIETTICGEKDFFEIMCTFYIDGYKIYLSGNRLFFLDENTNTKYYYYGD